MCATIKKKTPRVRPANPNAACILIPASQIIPERGTWVVVECHGDKIFRVAWTCPKCATTFYDHLGLEGKKIPRGQRRKVEECPKCIEGWRKACDEYYENNYNRRNIRLAYPPRPGQILLKDARPA